MVNKIVLLRNEGELLRRLAEEAGITPGALLRKLILAEALRCGAHEPNERETEKEEVYNAT
jgi:hypothetical protein